jgi:flagellar protein FliS
MTTGLNQYQRDAVLSASPAQLVTMLYDRLLVDLHRAKRAQAGGDFAEASVQLIHAQRIVQELAVSLDTSRWAEGTQLAAVYEWVQSRLIHANIRHDAEAVIECIALLEPLQSAWHEVLAGMSVAPPASTATSEQGGVLGVA